MNREYPGGGFFSIFRGKRNVGIPADSTGDRRQRWAQVALEHGLSESGCSAGWCSKMLSGCDTKCEKTVWLAPVNLLADSTRFNCRSVHITWSSNTASECGCSK